MRLCDQWLSQYYGVLDYRDFSLLDRAVRTLLSNILKTDENTLLPWHPFRGITPSHIGFRGIWNWDTAFHAVGVSNWDAELAREQIDMFLRFQQDNGALPDVVFEDGRIVEDFGKPPVMPWAAMLVDQKSPDIEFVRRIYPDFVKYEEFWMSERGGRKNGLFNYDCSDPDPEKRISRARLESGWDNSVRWDNGIYNLWPVDLNCYMLMLYRAMGYFANRLDQNNDEKQWHNKEQELKALIESQLWSEENSSYLDYNFTKKRHITVLTPASFMPLYVKIASSDHAALMAKIGRDRNKFTPGWPTVAYDDSNFDPEGYWRGRTWINVAYFALKGLKNYGYDEIAEEGRDTLLEWASENPDYIYENYHPLTGKGLGVRSFSWSAVFIIELLIGWKNTNEN